MKSFAARLVIEMLPFNKNRLLFIFRINCLWLLARKTTFNQYNGCLESVLFLSLTTDAERLRPQRTPFHFNKARKKILFCIKLKACIAIAMTTPTTTMTKYYLTSVMWKNSTQGAQLDWKTLKLYQTKCVKKSTQKFYISDKQPQFYRRLSKPTLLSYTVL